MPTKNEIRDRIVDFQRIKAGELMDNAGNWRLHPDAQRDGLDGVLTSVGIADSLIAYKSERNQGKLTLIDGHLRKSMDPEQVWPVQITDLNDSEADLILATLDPLAGLAKMDAEAFTALKATVQADDWKVRELLRGIEREANELLADVEDIKNGKVKDPKEKDKSGPDEMELLPFEHYDYILVMFRNELDWLAANEILHLERKKDPRRTGKIGFCRVIDGSRLVEMIRGLQSVANKVQTELQPFKPTPPDEQADSDPEGMPDESSNSE